MIGQKPRRRRDEDRGRLAPHPLHARRARLCRQRTLRRSPMQDGFVDTGDMVELRGDRYHFVGRRGGIINIGGLKVHPEEIEAVINRHGRGADVARAIAHAARSPVRSWSPTSFSPTACDKGRSDEIRNQILADCRASLAPHKVPAVITFVEALDITRPASWREPMRNVVVTGGSRGIGLAIARRLAAAGYNVIARGAARKRRVAARPSREVGDRRRPSFRSIRPQRDRRHPGLRQDDCATNSARSTASSTTPGSAPKACSPPCITPRSRRWSASTSLSPIVLTKYVVRHMMADGEGRIVNMSSIIATHRL